MAIDYMMDSEHDNALEAVSKECAKELKKIGLDGAPSTADIKKIARRLEAAIKWNSRIK